MESSRDIREESTGGSEEVEEDEEVFSRQFRAFNSCRAKITSKLSLIKIILKLIFIVCLKIEFNYELLWQKKF